MPTTEIRHPTLQRQASKAFDLLLLGSTVISIWGAVIWIVVAILLQAR